MQVGSVNVYDDNDTLKRLRGLKVHSIPCSTQSLMEFRDSIIELAADMPNVSKSGKEALLNELTVKLNGIIVGFLQDVVYDSNVVDKNASI